ncbi:hypothetical protein Acr_22g0005030 [Actinidia rufa]|uniref:Glycosyltransferase n=1 Tax=Actinidia rufa TaxID=165716 RepID=A0A7J0GJZ6_9ERIC|nr:hypothetical protein Acr_22g0005030 [Actinidia rufa]
MLPWLAHGHVSPFLELSKALARRNFHIYFCSTPIILTSLNKKLIANNNNNHSLTIELVQLHLPSSPELPPHSHTTNGHPTHLMNVLKTAFDKAGPPFTAILKTLNPHLVIYDHNQPWAPAIASSQNIPAIQFLTYSATSASLALHLVKNLEKQFPFPEFSFPISFRREKAEASSSSDEEGRKKDIYRFLEAMKRSCGIVLIKSFRDLEGKCIDFLSVLAEKKIVPVGPLVESPPPMKTDEDIGIIDWLDKKNESSTVFVSFGSECFLTKEEIQDVAHGLELSEVSFIWVIRFPLGEKIIRAEEVIPEGFLKRVGERGMVVEGWAPQAQILAHSSTDGFVSHCGWSSVMESMSFGVPVIAMPMKLDQPLNARLVEVVGVGVEVKRDENERFGAEEIAQVIREGFGGRKGGECKD